MFCPVHPDFDAGRANELDERFDVANSRHVLENDRVFGEQRRADDRQRGVLVPRGPNGTGQGMSALDDELQCFHVVARRCKGLSTAKNGGILERWSMRRALSMRDVRLTLGFRSG